MERGIQEKDMRDDERRREEGKLHVKISIKKPSQPKAFGIVKAKSEKKKQKNNTFFLDYIIYNKKKNVNHYKAYGLFSSIHKQNSTMNSNMHLSTQNCSLPSNTHTYPLFKSPNYWLHR